MRVEGGLGGKMTKHATFSVLAGNPAVVGE